VLRYILRRVGLSFVTLLILLVIVFFLTSIIPGDPAKVIAAMAAPIARRASSRPR